MSIKIRFQHTGYGHWGRFSGYPRLVSFLDTSRFHTEIHAAPDIEDANDLPSCMDFCKPWIKEWIGRATHMPWYKLPDLTAELHAFEALATGRADIVHFLDGEHCGAFLPRAIRSERFRSARTIASFHQPPDVLERQINPNLLKWFDAILVVSPSQIPYFCRYVAPERIHLILHGIDTDFFHPIERNNNPLRVRCITVGHWLRDWEVFEAVARATPEITFDVVSSREDRLRTLPNVNLFSGVSDQQLADLYRQADILFMPLIESTANNGLLEGIASGLPVVATDLESVRAYLPGQQGVLAPRGASDEMANAIRTLAQDADRRKAMGIQSRQRAEELSWSRLVSHYENLYEKVLTEAAVSLGDRDVRHKRTVSKRIDSCATELARGERLDEAGARHLRAGRYLTAERIWLQASKGANGCGVHASLAAASEGCLKWKQAVVHWQDALSYASVSQAEEITARIANCHLQMGHIAQTRQLADGLGDTYPARALFAQIDALTDIELAGQRWNECTIRFPSEINGFLGRIHYLRETQQTQEAGDLVAHVTRVWPESPQAAVLWACYAIDLRDFEEARARWDVLMRKHAHHAGVRNSFARSLATICALSGSDIPLRHHASAEMQATYALELAMFRGDFSSCVTRAQDFSHLAEEDPLVQLQLASLLLASEHKSEQTEGLSILRKLRDFSPHDALLAAYVSEAHFRTGNYLEGDAILDEVCAEDHNIELKCQRTWSRLAREQDSELPLWEALAWRFDFLGERRIHALRKRDFLFRSSRSVFAVGLADRWRFAI